MAINAARAKATFATRIIACLIACLIARSSEISVDMIGHKFLQLFPYVFKLIFSAVQCVRSQRWVSSRLTEVD